MVYQRKTSKEIAAATGLAVGTVDTYISEAIAALGARNRRHAAETLHELETPGNSNPALPWVAPIDPDASPGSPPEWHVGWADLLPLRRRGASGNDLRPLVRLGWIFGLASLLAIAFGMLAVGAEVVSRLYTGR